MNFIKLTQIFITTSRQGLTRTSRDVFVSAEKIRMIAPSSDAYIGKSFLFFDGSDETIRVLETPEEILNILKGAEL